MPGGESATLIGLAVGIYGLTQAIFQIPLGRLSDYWGRKKTIYLGLIIFIFGSLVAALADSLLWLCVGRAIQGAGAVSSAVIALNADLTRDEVRTKSLACPVYF
jgi:MFS family permease